MIAFAWIGPVWVLGYLITWIGYGHNLPPPSFMGMTGEQLIADYYGKYQSDIQLGMALCAAIGMLYMGWSTTLATFMVEQNDGQSSLFSNLELGGGILTGWLLSFCPAIWLACAVFAHRVDPEIIMFVHAATWFQYDMTYMITGFQLLGIGLFTVLVDQKVFPRWAGWAALAVGATFIPLTLIPFVSTGPFSVDGSWNFYIVFGTWGFAFFSVYSFYLLKELYRQRRQLQGHGVPQTA